MGDVPCSILSLPSDPALHSCGILPASNYSDDLEALHAVHQEDIAAKNKLGIVIQHRAWKVGDVFKSEEDYQLESPCARGLKTINTDSSFSDDPSVLLQSSPPPSLTMPLISSPVNYPPSSSPPELPEHRKRTWPPEQYLPNKRRLLGEELPNQDSAQRIAVVDAGHAEGDSPEVPEAHFTAQRPCGPFVEDGAADDQDPGMLALFQSIKDGMTVLPQVSKKTTWVTPSNYPKQYEECSSRIRTTSGKTFTMCRKTAASPVSYEKLIAARSVTAAGRAKKSYYGIDIHSLLDEAAKTPIRPTSIASLPPSETPRPSIEVAKPKRNYGNGRTMMWTEKYRARKFTDLCGDERTHRTVLRWLKGWDPIVFPGISKPKPKSKFQGESVEEPPHRKILLLTGPPGLGKTTLAHVCARQAGYEIVEINASDERSREVVKGRMKDIVGTENVKGINTKTTGGTVRKAGRPVCVIVDEVDGVVSGSSGGGEGGFIKALIDLVVLDQKNSNMMGSGATNGSTTKRGKKGDRFRLLRPMILICNDVYHPALRPLRASNIAEVIHIRKPPLDKVVARMKTVFDREGIASDGDGVRRLCEATWGISNRRESRSTSSNTGEGDIRGVLVVGEWVAAKLRASSGGNARLTRKWVEQNMLDDLSHGGGGSRGIGRGGAKEAVDRVFLDGAGFPKSVAVVTSEETVGTGPGSAVGVAELGKRKAMERLREIIDTSGECDRIMTDCFTAYPSQPFQDDTFLSKPNSAYDWLHFHDTLSSKIFSGQEWELNPYLSQSILGFHHLFASPTKHSWSGDQKQWGDDNDEEPVPFTGPRADFSAYEAEKQNRAILLGLQSSLSVPLLQSFRSVEEIATDLLPHLIKMLTPDVKPIVVGGSGDQRGTASVRKEGEREMVQRAVGVMSGVGVIYERSRIDSGQGVHGGYVYRMEPPLDTLATFETASPGSGATSAAAPTRYAVRQVLDQEYQKDILRRQAEARQARFTAGGNGNLLGNGSANANAYHDPNKENHHSTHAQTNNPKPASTATATTHKRDFFGRIILNEESLAPPASTTLSTSTSRDRDGHGGVGGGGAGGGAGGGGGVKGENKVWVSFHEGFSNAVRKPVSLGELVRGL